MRKGIQPISKRIELELMRMERVSHRIALMSPSLQPLTTGLRHRVTSLKALTIGLIQVRARLIPALGRLMPVILQIDASDIDSLRYYWWYRFSDAILRMEPVNPSLMLGSDRTKLGSSRMRLAWTAKPVARYLYCCY